jgi:ABC-type antimicrobial peptide transport system permease subunit
MTVPPAVLVQAATVALAAGLLASVYPAVRSSRAAPAAALREE